MAGAKPDGREGSKLRDDGDVARTAPLRPTAAATPREVRRFRLTRVDKAGAGSSWESVSDVCSIGSHSLNDVVLDESTVSRFHCDVRVESDGLVVRDLGSRNGTLVDGVRVREAFLRAGSTLRVASATLRVDIAEERNVLPLSPRTEFGSLVGASVAMRSCFALLERAAARDVTVLVEGESGTGKGRVAQALHDASARRDRPLVIVDCSAIPANLLESELFGHEKGAFTGAVGRRLGAFEEASGGTVFLDEIGELPLDLQPKLLRVLEDRHVRRVGANTFTPVDVRVIAATNRDLRAEVNAQRFRSDLFFRLAVVRIRVPPLREHPEDIPLLVQRILKSLGATPEEEARLRSDEHLSRLERFAWPGNVRELRNHLERSLVLDDLALPDDAPHDGGPAPSAFARGVSYAEARRRALEAFEQQYVAWLMEEHDGKVAAAAAAVEIERTYLYRLLRKHRVRGA